MARTFSPLHIFTFFTLVVIHSRRGWSVSLLWKHFFSLTIGGRSTKI
jgi:hypothetical protein